MSVFHKIFAADSAAKICANLLENLAVTRFAQIYQKYKSELGKIFLELEASQRTKISNRTGGHNVKRAFLKVN